MWAVIFENRVLREVFYPRREKLTANWRKFSTIDHNDLYASPNSIIRVIK
jgi:hypothetical protein